MSGFEGMNLIMNWELRKKRDFYELLPTLTRSPGCIWEGHEKTKLYRGFDEDQIIIASNHRIADTKAD